MDASYSLPNILPYDGEVTYHPHVWLDPESVQLFSYLQDNIAWRHDEVIMFGKHIVTARKMAWYAMDSKPYVYSKIERIPLAYNQLLISLQEKVEAVTSEEYNACLLNLYHSGKEGMGWHSDDEKSIKENSAIATVSFGAARKFSFKHKVSKETVSVIVDPGSILVMKGTTQKHWLHAIPKSTKVGESRISLTFRKMV